MAHPSPSPSAPTPPSLKLTEHSVLIFDVYGTLIDWESAIHNAFAPVFPALTREEILINYAHVEGNLQKQFKTTPYSRILELAYLQLTAPSSTAVGISTKGEVRESSVQEKEITTILPPSSHGARRFGGSIPEWKPFPDTIAALHALKKHFALVVLSNVDDASFARTHEKLCSPDHPGSAYRTVTPDSPFSLILTAQQVGAYKPNPLMLESVLKQLSVNPDSSLPSNPSVHVDAAGVLVVANSIRHDIIPAKHHQLRSVWISRHGVNFIGNESNLTAHYSDQEGATTDGKFPCTWRYQTLRGMVDAVEREVSQKEV